MNEHGVKLSLLTADGRRRLAVSIGRLTDRVEVALISVGVFALAAITLANVIARNFFRSLYFAEEVAGILILIITFTGLSYGVRRARHIRMGAFLDAMPPRLKKIMIVIISFYGAAVMLIMSRISYDYMIMAKSTQQVTPALRIPFWITITVIAAGFFLAGIQYIRTVIKNLTEKEVWLSPEQQSEYESEESH